MSFCYINIGSSANDGSGDPLRTAFNKINDNFNYVIGLTGNVSSNVNLAGYATISYVNSGLANVSGVDLSTLNSALANVTSVNLSNLNNALANINVTLLSNVGNLIAAVTANTPPKIGIVSNLETSGTVTGQTVLNNSDNGLYVWSGSAWITASAAFTPNANSIASVQVVSSLPVSGNFEGRQVFLNGKLYIYSSSQWKSAAEALTPTANALTGIQIFTGASLPATTAADSGRTLFWTNQSNLYINIEGAWNNYNSYIQGFGNATIGPGTINSAALLDNVIVSSKIVAGAIGTDQLAANAITANKLAADSVTAAAIAAGTITAAQIAAGTISSDNLAANAVIAGKIAAGSISATEIAAGSIGAELIAANAITSAKIEANAITAVQLAAFSVYANAIQTNSITSAQIAANAITSVQLAVNSVYANALQSNSVTTDALAANAITSKHILANTITSAMIDSRGLTIRDSTGNLLLGQGAGAQIVLANTIVVADNSGTLRSLSNVVTQVSTSAVQYIGTYANNASADAAYGGSAPVNSVYRNTTDNNSYVKNSSGNWVLFLSGGSRGNYRIAKSISGSEWAGAGVGDAQAVAALTELGLSVVIRDEVTLYNSSTGFAETRFWTGSAWSAISQYINGGLVVNGTISANQLAADSVTAAKISSGAITTAKLAADGIDGCCISAGTISASKLCSGTASLTCGSFSLGAGATICVAQCCWGSTGVFQNSLANNSAGIFDQTGRGFALIAANRDNAGAYKQGAAAAFGKSIENAYNSNWRALTIASEWETGLTSVIYDNTGKTIASSYLAYDQIGGKDGFIGSYRNSVTSGLQSFQYNGTDYLRASACLANYSVTRYDTSCPKSYSGAEFYYHEADNRTWDILSGHAFAFSNVCKIGASIRTRHPGLNVLSTQVDLAGYVCGVAAGVQATSYNTDGSRLGQATLAFNGYAFLSSGCAIYGPFTGGHDAYIHPDENIEIGDIVVDTEIIAKPSVSETITKVTLSSIPNQKSVVGVYSSFMGKGNLSTAPGAITEPRTSNVDSNSELSGNLSFLIDPVKPEYIDTHLNFNYIVINALGEGLVNVCGEGGDIEIGDLITSSSIPGKGMKQADDIIRNYTVAKSREAVTFSSPTEIKQIAVIYHCG